MSDELNKINEIFKRLSKTYPEFAEAFQKFMDEAEKESSLDLKTKEIISVALAVSRQCKKCIYFHVNNALKAGANSNEIIEGCLTAVLMGGGPSLMYMEYVFDAIDSA
ncbi:MAG: carboxymuconolactone decarboxylase family protein [Nanobdellota archaeon]